ncbi:SusC/RagA family TonB-linked outer membrane protein [Pedobacter sp.]
MRIKNELFCILFVLLAFSAVAQNPVRIEGVVLGGANQLPIVGVSVKIKGSMPLVSTTTNEKGRFSITVPKTVSGPVLVFSHLLYQQQEHRAVVGKDMNIQLEELVHNLKDVVVLGYGTALKKDLTGSVGSVDITEFQKAPVRTLEEALQGRIAGVQVSSGDGQPGSGFNVVIRGGNSLTQDNSPLYVIDGFPIESPDNNMLNPDEIESIDVLKDASATAIYGARGANGVIVITTNRGKLGEPTVAYKGSLGFQKILNTMDLMSPYEFVKLQNEITPSLTASLYLTNGRTIEDYRNVQAIDWQDKIFRTAPMSNHYISLNGGSSTTKYSLSGSAIGQDGVILNSGVNRYQGRFTLDQNIGKIYKAGVNLAYTNTSYYGTAPALEGSNSSANLLYSVWGYRPMSGNDAVDLENVIVDPTINTTNDNRWNPVLTANNEYRKRINNSVVANGYIEAKILPELILKVTGGFVNSIQRAESFNNSLTRWGNPDIGVSGVNGAITYRPSFSWLNENTVTYKRKFGAHSFNFVVGMTSQGVKSSEHGYSAIQIPNESLGISGLDEGTMSRSISTSTNNRISSFLSRVTYDYKSKYLATFSMRADGSSKFAGSNRWGYFPAGSIAWRIKKEPFLNGIKEISDAKIRLSYGQTGNNRVSDFAYFSTITFPINGSYSFNNTTPQLGAIPTSLENRDLRWETTGQANVGLDLSLFRNKVSLTVDAYRKTTKDLLLRAQLPTTSGFDEAFKNVGKTRNEGLEITLNTKIIDTKNFKWDNSFNISFNRSKVLGLNDDTEAILSSVSWDSRYDLNYLYLTKLGHPMTQFYGYIWEGNYQLSDFDVTPSGSYVLKNNVPDNGSGRASMQPGDIKYKDINGDGTITASDATIIGRALPIHIGGFTNNFKYKGFDLNVFFQWSYGNDIFDANRLIFEGTAASSVNQYASFTNRWSLDNQNNILHRVNGQGPRGYAYSSRLIEDGSYIRLKTVALGYNLNGKLVKRWHLKGLRVFASGQNLLTWTKYSGMDPEVSVKSGNNLTPGFDYSAYPRSRTLTMGLNLTL